MRYSRLIVTLIFVLTLTQSLYAGDRGPDVGEPREQIAQRNSLLGSWVVHVQSTGSPEFNALQTFQLGGTVNETSDLLSQGGEGPGQGAWQRTDDGYAATFELFIFNPDGSKAGRIRVRETITLTDENHFTGFSVADIILPDGEVIENIDNGPITGTRVSVREVTPADYVQPNAPAMRGRRAW